MKLSELNIYSQTKMTFCIPNILMIMASVGEVSVGFYFLFAYRTLPQA